MSDSDNFDDFNEDESDSEEPKKNERGRKNGLNERGDWRKNGLKKVLPTTH